MQGQKAVLGDPQQFVRVHWAVEVLPGENWAVEVLPGEVLPGEHWAFGVRPGEHWAVGVRPGDHLELEGVHYADNGILLGDHLGLVGVHEADKGVEGIVGKFEGHWFDKGVEGTHIAGKKAGKTDLEEVAYPSTVDNAALAASLNHSCSHLTH